jgi:hypothetical protein
MVKRKKSSTGPTVHLVRRRCRVCDWDSLQIEPATAEVPCPWCHAPTDRTVLLEQIAGLGSTGKNPYAAALGRLGGLKGGRARARRLTAERRTAIARKAARARWRKK